MRRKHILTSFTAAFICACAVQADILNSERIEQRFGSYGVEVIEQSPVLRRSNLFSNTGAERTCRTYAIVRFLDTSSPRIEALHRQVLDGASIGATFAAAGWQIHKTTLYIDEIDSRELQDFVVQLMRLQSPAVIGLHVYRLSLLSGSEEIHYATILEAHHPDYLGKAELLDIYAVSEVPQAAAANIDALRNMLLKPGE